MASKLDLPHAQDRRDFADLSIAVVAGLAFALTILFIFAVPLAGNLAASRDFVSYWAAGRQLVRHANPYDRDAISALEHSAGFSYKAVLIMRNPPWALPLAYPLGWLGLRVAAALWTLLLLASLLISVRMVHQLYGSPPNHIHWLGFAFTPALICLTMGQTSLFALLGLVLFLRLHRRRPFAAGAALWLCALKPHLFLPFAAALALWIVVSRSYRLLAGTASAIALSSAAAFAIDPAAFADYTRMMRSPAVENEFIPCLADALRHWLSPQSVWLQYLPAALCCLWALFYFWRRRTAWDWLANGSPLMLVSILAAPYCWFYDQGLAIPALLDGAYATRSRKLLAALTLLILLADIEICVVRVISPLYLWTAPAWLAWYLLARTKFAQPAMRPLAAQP
ncbi:MAG: glycosyltransferase 87 family protein [Terracidiphilus sp.]